MIEFILNVFGFLLLLLLAYVFIVGSACVVLFIWLLAYYTVTDKLKGF